jgi:hypothetical protein
MENELSSLEIGFIDIMDEVNIIPINGGGIPLMSGLGQPTHSMGGMGGMVQMGGMGGINNMSSMGPMSVMSNMHSMGAMNIAHRIENEHLLIPPHDQQMPYLLDHDIIRKRAKPSGPPPTKKRDSPETGFDELDDSKRQSRKPQVHKKCEHNTRKSECKLCGGSQICSHKRIKSRCKECGGSQICEHKKIRTRCKDCKNMPAGSYVQGDDSLDSLQHIRV